jgi:TfoX/Sxy family transcriptional regulator of competence genes
VARFRDDPSVTPPSKKAGKFGSAALKVDGKIFAFLSQGELVVKLPQERVDELVDSGKGNPYGARRGKVMKEWVAISPERSRTWPKLAEDAREFAGRSKR